MEIESFDKSLERRILIGMITDISIVSAISSIWQKTEKVDLFKTNQANLIAKWCLTHYQQRGEAVDSDITSYFQQYRDKHPDGERTQLVESLLVSLNIESEHRPKQSTDYLIDCASKYFTGIRLERIADRIKTGVRDGKIEDSLDAINSFSQVELGADMGINPFRDEEAIRRVFASAEERLIHFPDAGLDDAALFFGDTFSRDTLVSFLASEKSGKCQSGNTRVLCDDGIERRIEDIVKNQLNVNVLSWDGCKFQTRSINHWFDNGVQECFKIKTKSGREIEATANHPFLTPDGWRPLDRLKKKDFLAVPKGLFMVQRPSSPTLNQANSLIQNVLESPILWDEIVSIEPVGERQTYDIEVEGLHNFVANDFVVHNSFQLLDLAVRAVIQGKRVAYFEVGDLSQNQVMMRLMQRVLKRPKRQGIIKIPERIEFDDKFNADVTFYSRNIKKVVSQELVNEKFAKFNKSLDERHGYDELGLLKLSCHPSGSINVTGIESRLNTWERAGWLPDIVIIDYADILAPLNGRLDKRHQVDETWRELRGLSQKRHICVITASQADAASYRIKTLDKSNFSESKTKLAHVSAFIGINALPNEKDMQLRRLNYIVRREEAFSEQECLYVAGCLSIANPMILTRLLIR